MIRVLAAIAFMVFGLQADAQIFFVKKQIVVNIVSSISPTTGKAYGAVCNGTTDDGPAFNQFISDYSQNWWSATATYAIGQTVMSHDGSLYTSKINSNTGNNPAFGGNSGDWTNAGVPPDIVLQLPAAPANCHFPGDNSDPTKGKGFTTCGDPFDGNFVDSIPRLTFIGNGTTISGTLWLPGCGAGLDDTGTDPGISPFATVYKGNKCVTLTTASQAQYFPVGQWSIAVGIALQVSSFPPNPQFFDYLQVASSNVGTGVVCFTTALKNTYKSTWPFFNSSFNNPAFGPGTLLPLNGRFGTQGGWDSEVKWIGLGNNPIIWNGGALHAEHRHFSATNVTCIYNPATNAGNECFNPTLSKLEELTNFTDTNFIEIDKLIEKLNYTNSDIGGGGVGAISANVFCTNSKLGVDGSFAGAFAAGNFVGNNCTFNKLTPDSLYGYTTSFVCTNCTTGDFTPFMKGFEIAAFAGVTMTGGVITIPNSVMTSQSGVLATFAPGGNYCFGYNQQPIKVCATQAFQVTDMTQDSTNTYVTTTRAGGFPSLPTGGSCSCDGNIWVFAWESPQFSFTGGSGSVTATDLAGMPAGLPLWTYSSRTYTGAAMAGAPAFYIMGALSQATYNVTVADSTQATIKANAENISTMVTESSISAYDPIVNLKTAAVRTVTSSGTSGTQTGDTISSPGTSPFFGPDQFSLSAGVNPGGDSPVPSITVTVQTNPGIVLPP